MSPPDDLSRIARHALLGAAGLTVALVLCWAAVFHIGYVQRIDASVFHGFSDLRQRPHVGGLASFIANLCDPRPYLVLCLIPLAIALLRRRFLIVGAIAGILAGANLSTHVLKPLLSAPRPGGLPLSVVPQASWPSGHATASMALALCLVLACPGRLRPYAAACGAAFAVAVSYSFLTLGWHYPSDALAGFLVASIWTLLAIATVARLDRRLTAGQGSRPPQLVTAATLTPAAAVLALVLVVACLVLAARPDGVLSYARLHTAFVVGAAALGAVGLSLATGVMMTLGRGPLRADRAQR
jgi:membrane-associated phospholipid phosphatase